MDEESNSLCEGKGITRNTSHCGFTSPDLRIKKKRLFACRDFPIGVGPPQKTSNQSIKDSIRLEVPESTRDSSPEELKNPSQLKDEPVELLETVIRAKAQMYPPSRKIPVHRCFPQDCEAKNPDINTGVYADFRTCKKVTCNNEAVELPEKGVQMAENMCQSQRRISVIRNFPQGCVAKNPLFDFPEKGVQIAENMHPPPRRTSVIRHFPQGCLAKNPLFELPEKGVQIAENTYPPRRRTSVIRDFPEGCLANPKINKGGSLVSVDFRTEQKGHLSDKMAEFPEKAVQTAAENFLQGSASKVPQSNAGMMLISPDCRHDQRQKVSELLDEVVQTAEKMKPPQRRISVTTCFPQGCSKRDPEIDPGLLPILTDYRNKENVEQCDRTAAQIAVEINPSESCLALTPDYFRANQKVKLSDHADELIKRVVQIKREICATQRGISETRNSPRDCVAKNPQINAEVVPTTADFRTELQECYVQNEMVQNDAAPTKYTSHQINLASTSKITKQQSNHDCFEDKREKIGKNEMEEGGRRLLSSRKRKTCNPQENASIDSKKPSHRMTVMALAASTNYHSMLKKAVKKKRIAGQDRSTRFTKKDIKIFIL